MKINTNLYVYRNDDTKDVSFVGSPASSDSTSTNKASFSGMFSPGEFEKNSLFTSLDVANSYLDTLEMFEVN